METWLKAKKEVHDISGIEYPEKYLYEEINGVFYPVEITDGPKRKLFENLINFLNVYENILTLWYEEPELCDEVLNDEYPFKASFNEIDVRTWVDDSLDRLKS